jgi:hypothetical protein
MQWCPWLVQKNSAFDIVYMHLNLVWATLCHWKHFLTHFSMNWSFFLITMNIFKLIGLQSLKSSYKHHMSTNIKKIKNCNLVGNKKFNHYQTCTHTFIHKYTYIWWCTGWARELGLHKVAFEYYKYLLLFIQVWYPGLRSIFSSYLPNTGILLQHPWNWATHHNKKLGTWLVYLISFSSRP